MSMRPKLACFGLAFLISTIFAIPSVAQTTPAPTNANLPITRVSLYTSGVGYFERRGEVDGTASQNLLFPVNQMNDILKSLVLLDTGGGSIEPVTYAAQDPVNKQLQAFSVDLSDNPDRATLLNRLRGAEVRVSLAAPATLITGSIVGVEQRTITLPNSEGTTQQSTLSLMTDDGLMSIPLDSVSAIKFLDPALDAEIRAALGVVAQGRDAQKRAVTLSFSGHGKRPVLVGYVTATPLWQTSYRLVLGDKPVLQGWALVQNTSQDDWANVHLSLVSGRPISFIQDLYTPLYVTRPTIEAQVAQSIAPQTHASNLDAKAAANAPMNSLAESSVPPAPVVTSLLPITQLGSLPNGNIYQNPGMFRKSFGGAALQQSIATTGAKLGQSFFAYDISVPVSVPRQQSAMIPFLSEDIRAKRVSIYNQSVLPDHPLSGARMVNTSKLHLMGGPITVFDSQTDSGNGYVGDAVIDDTEPGQTRLFSFAVDTGVDAASKQGDSSGITNVFSIANGLLQDVTKYQVSMIYTFKNNSDEARTVVVEQPIQGDNFKLIEPAVPSETTASLYRFDVPLGARDSKKFTVRQEETDNNQIGLIDCDLPTLFSYSKSGDLSPEMKRALSDILTRRRAIQSTSDQISTLSSQIESINRGQDRIRENMKALDHTSDLYKRYVSELDSQETTLQNSNDKIAALQNQLAQQRQDLADYVSHLTVQ